MSKKALDVSLLGKVWRTGTDLCPASKDPSLRQVVNRSLDYHMGLVFQNNNRARMHYLFYSYESAIIALCILLCLVVINRGRFCPYAPELRH